MKKHWAKLLLAVFLELVVANAVFAPGTAKVYAAGQAENQTVQQQANPPDAEGEKTDDGGHAGHHG